MVAKYAIEHWVRIPVEIELAHEFRYRDPILTPRTLVVAISQSGETMDTFMALRHAREQGSRVLAICNTQGSTIPRESDAVLYTHAGPEIAVASTKAFVAQVVAAYMLGSVPSADQRHDVPRRDSRHRRAAQGHARQDPMGARHAVRDGRQRPPNACSTRIPSCS
jgi:glucosamine 6-phosphate synthetase-like amidotransferase/phosphosugar isomerase protein